MNYSFPPTKWIRTATADKQIKHVSSEMIEVLTSENGAHELEEALDLYHSLETYFRICERDGIDINKYRQMVQAKNEARGYYAD
jgi:hypothetical protein